MNIFCNFNDFFFSMMTGDYSHDIYIPSLHCIVTPRYDTIFILSTGIQLLVFYLNYFVIISTTTSNVGWYMGESLFIYLSLFSCFDNCRWRNSNFSNTPPSWIKVRFFQQFQLANLLVSRLRSIQDSPQIVPVTFRLVCLLVSKKIVITLELIVINSFQIDQIINDLLSIYQRQVTVLVGSSEGRHHPDESSSTKYNFFTC